MKQNQVSHRQQFKASRWPSTLVLMWNVIPQPTKKEKPLLQIQPSCLNTFWTQWRQHERNLNLRSFNSAVDVFLDVIQTALLHGHLGTKFVYFSTSQGRSQKHLPRKRKCICTPSWINSYILMETKINSFVASTIRSDEDYPQERPVRMTADSE